MRVFSRPDRKPGRQPSPNSKHAGPLKLAPQEIPTTTVFSIRLVAQTTKQGFVDFKVEAESASAGAAIIAAVHDRTEAAGTGWMTLPDGQEEHLEIVDVVRRQRTFYLLNDAGVEVAEIPFADAPSRPQ